MSGERMPGEFMPGEFIGRVTGVIARVQHIPPESVTIDSTFEELKIDSLDGINILFAIEGEFDVDIPDDAARNIRSVREMIEGVAKLLAAKEERSGTEDKSGKAKSA
jgi:acyl carrier protein